MDTHRVFNMSFAGVYPHYVQKAEKKGRTKDEVDQVICGVRIEEIENPLMKNIRYMDKLVDELAKGRPLDKIMRK